MNTGIRAFAAADTATRVGVDLIVTDHHLPETNEGVPHALAVLNPNQPGCEYPCKSLCGAGVAFKVCSGSIGSDGPRAGCCRRYRQDRGDRDRCGRGSTHWENRLLTKIGSDGLRDPRNVGLKAILEIPQVDISKPIMTGEIAFRVARRD